MTARWRILQGDCREQLRTLNDASVDACVTDPPYELGFMGKQWDSSGVAFDPETWRGVLRVLKPGGHLLAFGGTRTVHRMACAIEDAGFEIRDQIDWLYGQGFPKSLNVGKAIDAGGGPESIRRLSMGEDYEPSGRGRVNYDHGGGSAMNGSTTTPALSEAAQQWAGWGTALKPGHEPIVMARKPLDGTVAANVLAHGTGALNIDACRIGYASDSDKASAKPGTTPATANGNGNTHGHMMRAEFAQPVGRWPANVILDEGAAAELDAQSGQRTSGKAPGGLKRSADKFRNTYAAFHGQRTEEDPTYGDTGGASRFFYVVKPSRRERNTDAAADNDHPTVKPVELLRYLVRLVTPGGGLVLDPFTGSGTTGIAALQEGMQFLGCELDAEYVGGGGATHRRRFAAVQQGRLMARGVDILNAVATVAGIVSVGHTIYDAHQRRKKEREDDDKDRRIRDLEAEVERLKSR